MEKQTGGLGRPSEDPRRTASSQSRKPLGQPRSTMGGSTRALSLLLDRGQSKLHVIPLLGLQTTWPQHYQWLDQKRGLLPVTCWGRCIGVQHPWHSCSVEYATEPGHVQVRHPVPMAAFWQNTEERRQHYATPAAFTTSEGWIPFSSRRLKPCQWTEPRGCAKITKWFQRCLVSANDWGRGWGLTGEHHALVQTSTFLSSLGPLHSNLLMSAWSSCFLLPRYPISLIHVFAALLLSFLISDPVSKHSSSSSSVSSTIGFPLLPCSSWSPATSLQAASLIVTVLIICV